MFYETQECLHSTPDGCYRDSFDVTDKLMNAENKTWVIHVIQEPQCNPDTCTFKLGVPYLVSFPFNFCWYFLFTKNKMLKIKDKFAKILKLFSSVEKVETPPICMTVYLYYRIKSIVIFPFKIAIHFVVVTFKAKTLWPHFSVGFVLLLRFLRCPIHFPTRFFEKQNLREKNKFVLCEITKQKHKKSTQFCLQGRPDVLLVWSWFLKLMSNKD